MPLLIRPGPPREQITLARARRAAQPRQQHMVKFQALGLVHGHDLDRIRRRRVRRGKQTTDPCLQFMRLNAAGVVQPFDQVKKRLAVPQFGRLPRGRRSAECTPERFQRLPQWQALPLLDKRCKDRAESAQAGALRRLERFDQGRVMQTLPQRLALVRMGQLEQRIQTEAAPGRAQTGEPRHAVGREQPGAR